MRNCPEDEGRPLEAGLQEQASNLPKAALVKSQGGERLGKATAKDRGRYGSRRWVKRTIDEVSKR